MRVLFAVHHPLDPRLGAPKASISVAAALQTAGHETDFYGYDQAYGYLTETPTRLRMAFPWRLAMFLAVQPKAYDVIDVTAGDSYAWSAARRRCPGRRPILISRSNGLEHLAHEALMERVAQGEATVSSAYPLYNGGPRLWEVRQSLRSADGVILLNERERSYAADVLRISPTKLRVIAHGLDSEWDEVPPPASSSDAHARLCYVGRWENPKGRADLVQAVRLLRERGVSFSLLVAGCGVDRDEVVRDLPPELSDAVSVVPSYGPDELPGLLAGQEIFLFASRFEGWGLAVAEAMAAGLTPIATPVGAVPELVRDGINGFIVPHAAPEALVDRVVRLAADPALRAAMRADAWASSRTWRWSVTASRTLEFYEELAQELAGAPVPLPG